MTQQPIEELSVVIVSPDKQVWEGRASSVSSENSTGTFDVLPEHAKFVTMIKNKPIIIRTTTGGEKAFKYRSAVLVVNTNKVSIYSDI